METQFLLESVPLDVALDADVDDVHHQDHAGDSGREPAARYADAEEEKHGEAAQDRVADAGEDGAQQQAVLRRDKPRRGGEAADARVLRVLGVEAQRDEHRCRGDDVAEQRRGERCLVLEDAGAADDGDGGGERDEHGDVDRGEDDVGGDERRNLRRKEADFRIIQMIQGNIRDFILAHQLSRGFFGVLKSIVRRVERSGMSHVDDFRFVRPHSHLTLKRIIIVVVTAGIDVNDVQAFLFKRNFRGDASNTVFRVVISVNIIIVFIFSTNIHRIYDNKEFFISIIFRMTTARNRSTVELPVVAADVIVANVMSEIVIMIFVIHHATSFEIFGAIHDQLSEVLDSSFALHDVKVLEQQIDIKNCARKIIGHGGSGGRSSCCSCCCTGARRQAESEVGHAAESVVLVEVVDVVVGADEGRRLPVVVGVDERREGEFCLRCS